MKKCIFIAMSFMAANIGLSQMIDKFEPSKDMLAFVEQSRKKISILTSWQLQARIIDFNISKETYKNLLNQLFNKDPFASDVTEEYLMELLADSTIESKSSYELNFSKNMYRVKKIIAPEYVDPSQKSENSVMTDDMYIDYENNINGLASNFSALRNRLKFFKAPANSIRNVLGEYGVDVTIWPYDGLLKYIPNRKIDFEIKEDKVFITTSINPGNYEKLYFKRKDDFIYFIRTHAKMTFGDVNMLLLGYKKWPGSDLATNLMMPTFRIVTTSENETGIVKVKLVIVDSWIPKDLVESDLEIPTNKDTEIVNLM